MTWKRGGNVKADVEKPSERRPPNGHYEWNFLDLLFNAELTNPSLIQFPARLVLNPVIHFFDEDLAVRKPAQFSSPNSYAGAQDWRFVKKPERLKTPKPSDAQLSSSQPNATTLFKTTY